MIEGAIALVIFLLGQLGWLVWTLSDICAQLRSINQSLQRLDANMASTYSLKDGLKLESQMEAMWNKIDDCPCRTCTNLRHEAST